MKSQKSRLYRQFKRQGIGRQLFRSHGTFANLDTRCLSGHRVSTAGERFSRKIFRGGILILFRKLKKYLNPPLSFRLPLSFLNFLCHSSTSFVIPRFTRKDKKGVRKDKKRNVIARSERSERRGNLPLLKTVYVSLLALILILVSIWGVQTVRAKTINIGDDAADIVKVTGTIDMQTYKILNLGSPAGGSDTDTATKGYVDAVVAPGGGGGLPSGSVEGQVLRWDNTGSAWLSTSNLIIESGGNVGIGTPSPSREFHVYASEPDILLQSTRTEDPRTWGLIAQYEGVTQGVSFNIVDRGTDPVNGNTKRLTITNDGFVGIGVTNPSQKLHVESAGNTQIYIKATGGTDNAYVQFNNLQGTAYMGISGNAGDILVGSTDGAFGISHRTGQPIHISADVGAVASEGMTILENGNVGIGVASPDPWAKLDVDGTAQIRKSSLSVTSGNVLIDDNTTNFYTNPGFETGATSPWLFDAKTDGALAVYTSDVRSGAYSGKITNSTLDHIALWQNQTVTAGKTYTMSVYAKDINSPTTPYFSSAGVGASTVAGGGSFTGISTTEWKRFYWVFTPNTTGTFSGYIRTANNASQGDFLVDDLQFEEQTTATPYIDGTRNAGDVILTGEIQSFGVGNSFFSGNLGIGVASPDPWAKLDVDGTAQIRKSSLSVTSGNVLIDDNTTNFYTNPGFETGATSPWLFDAKTDGALAVYTSDVRSGAYSGKITNSTLDHIALWQNQTVTAGKTYTMSVYAKDINSPTTPYFSSAGVGASTVAGGGSFTGISTTEWKRFYWVFTPNTTGTFSGYIRTANNASQGDFLVDDLQFEEQTTATPYIDGTRNAGDVILTGEIQSFGVGNSFFSGNLGIGVASPDTLVHATVDSSLHNSPTQTDRILNWYGAGYTELWNSTIGYVFAASSTNTTQPGHVGLALYNSSTSDSSYAPALTFGKISPNGGYANGPAAISAQFTNNAVDLNWTAGDLVFFTADNTNASSLNFGLRERVRITSTGKVGIGNTSPDMKLDVDIGTASGANQKGIQISGSTTSGEGSQPALVFDRGGGATVAKIISVGGATEASEATLEFYTDAGSGAAHAMTIDEDGKVGIGVTNPYAPLVVKGATYDNAGIISLDTAANAVGIGGGISFGGIYTGTTTTEWARVEGYKENATDANYAGALVFNTRAQGAGVVEKMRITSTGKVGIGVTNPNTALHVEGDAMTLSKQDSQPVIMFHRTASNTPGAQIRYLHQFQDTTSDSGDIIFETRPPGGAMTRILWITRNGTVGIGEANPNSKLQVSNTASANDVLALQDSSGFCEAQPTTTGLTWSCSSDIALKENIRDASPVLNYLIGIPLSDYKVKSTGEETMGVIAQDMLINYPELVTEGDDGYLMVSELNSWMIVKAIQELSSKVEAIKELKAENDNLKQRIESLEQPVDSEVNDLVSTNLEIQSPSDEFSLIFWLKKLIQKMSAYLSSGIPIAYHN
ncbi:carbohydrate binding domain-containing protein [Patescibacteria group bacterium AH-259-L05]|nr:carbohydrate binding domain-containing protein [Patescibacteria group bacterium AH-259-L05]